MRPIRLCLFCGGRVNSKEHVWPVWLLAALGVETRRTRMRSERGTRPAETWSGFNLSLQVRHVCQRCNNRWMSALETRAQPFLRPLVAGTVSALEPSAQAAIATWAIKTAMAFEATRVEGDSFYSTDDRKFVREQARPPVRTSVWLGNYVGDTVALSHASDLTGSIEDGQPMRIHLTTLAFGRLVIQVSSAAMSHAAGQAFAAAGGWHDNAASAETHALAGRGTRNG